jgi:hypothetical protein
MQSIADDDINVYELLAEDGQVVDVGCVREEWAELRSDDATAVHHPDEEHGMAPSSRLTCHGGG